MHRFYGLHLRSISFNVFFQFIVRLFGSISTLLVTLIIASYLGYETIGSFIKVADFIGIFYLLVDFGLNPIYLKLFGEDAERKLGNLIALRLIIVVVLFPIILLATFLLPGASSGGAGYSQEERQAIILYALVLFSSALNISWQAILQRKLANKLTVPSSLISSTVLLLITYYAATTNNYQMLFGAFIVSGIVYSGITYFLLNRSYPVRMQVENLRAFAWPLLKVAWPLGLILFVNLVYSKVDIFLLSIFKQNIDVGIYGISYRFFEVGISIPTFLAASTYPILLKEMGGSSYQALFTKYLKFYLFASLILAPIAIFLSPLIQILNSEFVPSIGPLQILLLFLPLFFLTSLLQWHFIIKNKLKFLVPLYIGALVFNVVANIIFIPLYSYTAAAVITGLSEALVFIVMLWYFYKIRLA